MTLVSVLLGVLPALVLAALLVAGRYPGERLIQRLRPRRRSPAPADAQPPAASFVRSIGRRRGELLSGALAGRAPPPAPA